MKLRTKDPFGYSRLIVDVIDERGDIVGELHKQPGSWGTGTSYRFHPSLAGRRRGLHFVTESTIKRAFALAMRP